MHPSPATASEADAAQAGKSGGRPSLLFLCHRIPYPPNKGDKIRSWHLLRHLAAHYRVYLAAFVDEPGDWMHAPKLRRVCEEVFLAPLAPAAARLKSLRGLLTGLPLSLPYYSNRALWQWVQDVSRREQVQRQVVFSSAMGQFLPGAPPPGTRTIVDFVDVDSDKWRQYAESRKGPSAWLYAREARLLARWERELARRSDAALFVSAQEAAFFREHVDPQGANVGFYCNGVDAQYFDPQLVGAEVAPAGPELVFTGAMDYWPNVDAVTWFAQEVLPLLRQGTPNLGFTIVGGRPSAAVRELASLPGVTVTGRVPDVRPFLARALAVIAPMRVARGVQNKVLEGMAMARPVLVSAMGLEGIDAVDGECVLVAETAEDYRRLLERLMTEDMTDLGRRARELVLARYSWDSTLEPVVACLEGGAACAR